MKFRRFSQSRVEPHNGVHRLTRGASVWYNLRSSDFKEVIM